MVAFWVIPEGEKEDTWESTDGDEIQRDAKSGTGKWTDIIRSHSFCSLLVKLGHNSTYTAVFCCSSFIS